MVLLSAFSHRISLITLFLPKQQELNVKDTQQYQSASRQTCRYYQHSECAANLKLPPLACRILESAALAICPSSKIDSDGRADRHDEK